MGTVRIKLVRGGLLDMFVGHSYKVQLKREFIFISYWKTITDVCSYESALEVKRQIEEGKVTL